MASLTPMIPGDPEGSAAVRALIGSEVLGRLRGEAFRQYSCCRCGQPGRTDAGPASVIVERHRLGAVRVRLAHARCARSEVLELDAETTEVAGFGGMLSKSAVLEYATAPRVRPLLILEPKTELAEPTAGGEHRNPLISGLLDQGFTLLRTAGQLPAPADGWLPQLSPAWARLLAPDDTAAYDGPLTRPDPGSAWSAAPMPASS